MNTDNLSRIRFHRLVNAREDPKALADAEEWLQELLAAASMESAPEFPFQTTQESAAKHRAVVPGLAAELLAFHSPLALLEGAWLQSVAQAANTERAEVIGLFACYLALLGPDESASPAFAFRGRLKENGIYLPEATAWRFAHDLRIGVPALLFSGLQLALGLHSTSLFPETLGFTLAYLDSASPWRLPALPESRRHAVLATMNGHTQGALKTFLANHGEWIRVQRGYALYRTAEADYLAELENFAGRNVSLAERVAGIFQRKLRLARGYHSAVMLGHRGLEEWFADRPFDTEGFLAAFLSSPYAEGAKGQRLFDRLNAFGGPMFGVFDREEMALIDAWLEDAKDGPEVKPENSGGEITSHPGIEKGDKVTTQEPRRRSGPCPRPAWSPGCPSPAWPASAHSAGSGAPFGAGSPLPATREAAHGGYDARTLFHQLVNNGQQPEILAAARLRAEKVLARSLRAVRGGGRFGAKCFEYAPEAFTGRIERLHEEAVARHQPFKPPPKLCREEYVWGIRQFAPAILLDGCWLQYLGEAINQDKRMYRLLYRIYAEELGEGRMDWNHPKIYRDLLNELGIDLPAVETKSFVDHSGFIDSAFDLPVYLLAISRFPRTFLPEILGLNLAIELSGLGAGYMRLAEELRYWNINPLIVTLHLSIDNLAGGHAAMAAEAVESYLDEIRILSGDRAMQETWRRIWSGYLSLDAATRRFKWHLVLAYVRNFLTRKFFSARRCS